MKILLKILVAPFALALSLLAALLVFLLDICAVLLTIASVQRPKKGARRRLQSIRRKKEGKKQKYNPTYGRRREKESDTQHRQDHRGNRQQDGTNIKQEHQYDPKVWDRIY